ncbi:rod shape-determining protein RodA [Candidatus Fermentibacteria bacterium]|nr:rod shape-determining protein RodA [Candidatus Fermentibacteria bacterium]
MRDWDVPSLALVIVLCAVGVIMVHSATAGKETQARDMGIDQLIRVVIGFVLLAVVSRLPLRFWQIVAYPGYAVTLVLLAVVPFIGRTHGGATRWLGLGMIEIQPSELGKVAVTLALALFLADQRGRRPWRTIGMGALIVGIPFGLILIEPDLGTSLVLLPVAVGMMWWSGVPFLALFSVIMPVLSTVCAFSLATWAALMATVVAVLAWARAGFWRFVLVCGACVATGLLTPHGWGMLEDYQKTRILVFLNPGIDPRGSGWNVIQSRIAIGSGRILGKGLMGGTQKALAFLPAQHTDFIFSVIGEELGFVGTQMVMLLFAMLLWRLVGIAAKCRSRFAGIAAIGFAVSIATQVFINVGMTVGVLPVTGLPLPFVSYGGTHVIATLCTIGILQSLRRNWKETS